MSNKEGEMIQEMKKLITIDIEQIIQEDWAREESSKYCPYFKRLKTDRMGGWKVIGQTKTKTGIKKQLWTRASCGNIWREHEGRGGHPCRGCKMEKEKAEHRELGGIWEGFGDEYARLVDGFKGTTVYRRRSRR